MEYITEIHRTPRFERNHRAITLNIHSEDRLTSLQRIAMSHYIRDGKMSTEIHNKSEKEKQRLKFLKKNVNNNLFETLCKKGIIT